MLLAWFFTGMLGLSLVCGAATGRMSAVSAAALAGAGDAVTLLIQLGGALALFGGVMELMRRSRVSDALAGVLRPLLRRLLPEASRDSETLALLAANLSANVLGLGNAATPPGLAAARRMARGTQGRASDELCRLVVLNSCSVQLLPTTAAALRAANGAAAPLDILPAVWIASAASIAAGLGAARLLERLWP